MDPTTNVTLLDVVPWPYLDESAIVEAGSASETDGWPYLDESATVEAGFASETDGSEVIGWR